MASEQIGFICIIFLLSISIFYRKYKSPLWYKLGIFLFILGWLCLYFSPGHHARASMPDFYNIYLSIGEIISLDFYDKLMRLYITIKKFYTKTFTILTLFVFCIFSYEVILAKYNKYISILLYMLGVIILLVLGKNFWIVNYIFVFYFFLNKSLKKDSSYIAALFLLILFLVCALTTIQFPGLPFRARLGDGLLLIAIISILFVKYCNRNIFSNAVIYLSVIYGVYVLSAFIDYRIKWNNLLVYIEDQKQKGNYNIEVDAKIFNSYYRGFNNWSNPDYDPISWPNPVYAKVFGVESFVAK